MLGRVRTCSMSSLEVLEMERTPSKLLKDDSLSIYETTLMKLRQGAQRDLSFIPDKSTNTNTGPSMATILSDEALVGVNPPAYSTDSFPSSGNSQSMIISKEQPRGSLSVLYLFSRYKTCRNGQLSSSDDSAMAVEDDCSSADTSSHKYNRDLQQRFLGDQSSGT